MIIKRLEELGYQYSPSSLQVLNFPFHSAVKVGNLVYTSGQIPLMDDLMYKGKVGKDINISDAIKAAELCAFNCIRAAGSVVDINLISRVIKILGMVNCSDDFNDTSTVINGASKFFIDVFGINGMHARSAVGMQLPSEWSVEVEAIFEIR